MSIVVNTKAEVRPNFLESEVGLVLKTREIPASMGVQDGKYKIVKAGTPFPSDNSNAVGLVFEDIDVTDGNMPGSVMVAGRVLADRLSLASAAKTALSGKGFTFVDAPEITRGYTVTYDKNDGSGDFVWSDARRRERLHRGLLCRRLDRIPADQERQHPDRLEHV